MYETSVVASAPRAASPHAYGTDSASMAVDGQVDVLTARERCVVVLLADGMTAVAIGHRLGISPRTVHKHLENIYAKLGVSDRLGAVLRADAIPR